MYVHVSSNIPAVKKALTEQRRQVPFALSRALNATAADVQRDEQRVMEQRFDRPTPYTVNSLWTKRSTKVDLEAVIRPKDGGAGSGRSASAWLDVGVAGGARRMKGFELALRTAGILPSGMYVVPAAAAQLDVFGNWKRSELTRILVALRSGATAAASRQIARRDAKRGAPGSASTKYFVLRGQSDDLEPGIYERRKTTFGTAVRPIVIFTTRTPRYRRRLPFEEVARNTVRRVFERHFDREFAAAVASAKPKGGA